MQRILDRQAAKSGSGRFTKEVKRWGEKPQSSSHALIVIMGQRASPKNGLQDEQRGRQENVKKDGLVEKRKMNATDERSKELMFTGNAWIIVPIRFEQQLAPTGKAVELLLKSSKKKKTYRITGQEKRGGKI